MQITLPDTFNPEQSEKYRLIFRLQTDVFAFAIAGLGSNKFFHYQEIPYDKKISALENLKEIFFGNTFLVLPYKKLQVLTCSPSFTLVPSILYEEENKEAFFDFNFHHRSGICLSRFLPQPPVHVVFEMEKNVYEFFHRSLIHPEFMPHIAPLIAFFHQRTQIGNNHKMIINLHKDSIDIICFSPDELLLTNHYTCRNIDDMVYYTLFVWKQLKLDQLNDSACIIGDRQQFDDMSDLLQKYLKNVLHFQFPFHGFLFGENDEANIPSDILALLSCEL
ncbi:MAG: DUF3822 family protein [Dysgonamonadaceae bacterium]|nr:DUF3822 family protein [Dysgonamonadaceae bacterium]